MKAKKYVKVNFNRFRGTFFLLGMVISLLVVLGAFCYTTYDHRDADESPIDSFIEEPVNIVYTPMIKRPEQTAASKPNTAFINELVIIPIGEPEIIVAEDSSSIVVNELFEYQFHQDSFEETGEIPHWSEVSKLPEFKGGEKAYDRFVKTNLHYPERAVEKGLERKVVVQFVVWKDGSIRDIKILNPDNRFELLEDEAIRLIQEMNKLQKWIPAEQRDKKVPVWFNLPIIFRL